MTTDKPYQEAILKNTGAGFYIGGIGGSAFYFLKGIYNSPKGGRLGGGLLAARMNTPREAVFMAVFYGVYSTFDCSMQYVRQKKDPWNLIIPGAATYAAYFGLSRIGRGLGRYIK